MTNARLNNSFCYTSLVYSHCKIKTVISFLSVVEDITLQRVSIELKSIEVVLNSHKHAVKIETTGWTCQCFVTGHTSAKEHCSFAICFQALTYFPSEGQGWIPASAKHIYTVKWLQLSAAYFADVQHLSLIDLLRSELLLLGWERVFSIWLLIS